MQPPSGPPEHRFQKIPEIPGKKDEGYFRIPHGAGWGFDRLDGRPTPKTPSRPTDLPPYA